LAYDIRSFQLNVPQSEISDLKARLALTRFPDQAPEAPWTYGTDLGLMRRVVDHWRDRFDWRAVEAQLNALPQFMVEIGGIDVHYIKVEGMGPNPKPLLLSHGWPGSVLEFLDLIPRLTDPARFGGDAKDAVTVIAPSLPGYALSFKPSQRRFGIEDIADTFLTLMTDVLGYDSFAAQGGDWGSFVTARIADIAPDRVSGIHLNMVVVPVNPAAVENPSPAILAFADEMKHFAAEETGYQWIQGTRPQTLAFGLSDSPAALAAWIIEKFRAWTDCDGDVESVLTLDRMLGLISLYWFTGCIGASFHPYYARRHGPFPIQGPITTPTAIAMFPREIMHPPRDLVGTFYTNIRQWTEMPRGGHFAAMEQPEALARDIQAFLRGLGGRAKA
jgi:pimeloyl-ACP methyl ester carboxylesterase